VYVALAGRGLAGGPRPGHLISTSEIPVLSRY
jgi:hypothetical protein